MDVSAVLLGHKGPEVRVLPREHNIHEFFVGEDLVLVVIVVADQVSGLGLRAAHQILREEGVEARRVYPVRLIPEDAVVGQVWLEVLLVCQELPLQLYLPLL